MVQAYVSAQCAKHPLKTLLLLGEEATRFTVNVGEDNEAFYDQHKGSALLQSQWQCMALIAPSLVTMLKDPMQKRITWQALQTLVLPAS
jgi:uracil-DNA glycosylase